MRKIFLLIYITTFLLSSSNYLLSNIKNSIVVKVDNKIITSFEIKNKILSTLIIAGSEINQKNIDNLKGQTLENLIYYKLKEIELEKFNFKVNKQRLNEFMNRISNNDILKLKNQFENFGLDFNLWRQELETELKWRQFIFLKYSKKIDIDQNFIDNELERIINLNSLNLEVNLSEIEIFQNEQISNEKLISSILKEINDNGFDETAIKFSVSNTSSDKGSLGWINTNTLSKKINDIIKNLEPGQVSKPLVQTNSILFLKLNSKRNLKSTDIDKEKLKQNLIQQKENELFNLFSNSHLSKLKNNYFIEYQ